MQAAKAVLSFIKFALMPMAEALPAFMSLFYSLPAVCNIKDNYKFGAIQSVVVALFATLKLIDVQVVVCHQIINSIITKLFFSHEQVSIIDPK